MDRRNWLTSLFTLPFLNWFMPRAHAAAVNGENDAVETFDREQAASILNIPAHMLNALERAAAVNGENDAVETFPNVTTYIANERIKAGNVVCINADGTVNKAADTPKRLFLPWDSENGLHWIEL